MELRPYQQQLVDDIKASLRRGNRAVVAVLGCGGGKSVIQAAIAKGATDKGNRVLFLVHRRELCQQIYNTFVRFGVNMDLCDVSMVQTVCRRLDKLPAYDLIITDEAHHSTAATYVKIYNHFPDIIRLGFTATPVRLNRGGLGDVYTDLVESVSTQWLIQNHCLAPYHYYSVQLADTSKLHTVGGEFKQNEVSELMQQSEIYGDTVKQWEKLAKGKKTIVYCASVEAAENTAQAFCKAGYLARCLSGETPPDVRANVMAQFRSTEPHFRIQILCNCELFGEGLDVPDCECAVLLRPTQSLTLYIQQSMRAMRYLPGKTATIIDHVGNCYRHGLPDDDHVWTLEPKKVQENTVKIRECKVCFACFPPTMTRCPYCGAEVTHEIQTHDRKVVDVDLVELARTEGIKNTRLQDAEFSTWEEIVEFQKLHKYKFNWCLRRAKADGIKIPAKYNKMMWRLGI